MRSFALLLMGCPWLALAQSSGGLPALASDLATEVSDRRSAVADEAAMRQLGDEDVLAASNAYTDAAVAASESATLQAAHAYIDSQIAQQPSGPRINAQQIALLRWYPANLSGTSTYSVNGWRGMAFDGTNMWVASPVPNVQAGNVVKLRAHDGATVGTFPVGWDPTAVAFDGTNIWVANYRAGTVTKLRASDGAHMATIPVGIGPWDLTFDGTSIWVLNSCAAGALDGCPTVDGHIVGWMTKLRPTDGAVMGKYQLPDQPFSSVFDGEHIWVTTSYSRLLKLRPGDGAIVRTYQLSFLNYGDLAFDGAHLWIAACASDDCKAAGVVLQMRVSDSTIVGTHGVGAQPMGVAFDGSSIWVANYYDGSVTKLSARDGSTLGTFPVGEGGLGDIAFDGVNVWVRRSGSVVKL